MLAQVIGLDVNVTFPAIPAWGSAERKRGIGCAPLPLVINQHFPAIWTTYRFNRGQDYEEGTGVNRE